MRKGGIDLEAFVAHKPSRPTPSGLTIVVTIGTA